MGGNLWCCQPKGDLVAQKGNARQKQLRSIDVDLKARNDSLYRLKLHYNRKTAACPPPLCRESLAIEAAGDVTRPRPGLAALRNVIPLRQLRD